MRPGLLALALGTGIALISCPARDTGLKPAPRGASSETPPEAKGLDPRAAFESSGLLGGMTVVPETAIALIPPAGTPETGVALSLGGALSTAAIARRVGNEHELVLASGARVFLPGPALALVASGDRITVACAEGKAAGGGSILCFRAEGEGERLSLAWKRQCAPIERMLVLPGGRLAISDEAARLYLEDASTGAEIWGKELQAPAADIAYAPGAVLVGMKASLLAFDESTGAIMWSAALTGNAQSLSSGGGTALALLASGSLAAFSLADGKGIGAATGPFVPSIRPVVDGSFAIVGLGGGGAAEVDLKSGLTRRTWSWKGPTSFISADRDMLYAGVYGRTGRGLLYASRAGDTGVSVVGTEAPAFDAPLALSGARGGLLVPLMDGSLELLGKRREPLGGATALDLAIAPQAQTAAAISSALGRFKPDDGRDPARYLRFDLFVQGMPVDTGVSFTAFRYDPADSAKRSFVAQPASAGAIVAIFDESGNELAASIDELGSSSRAAAFLEKGSPYWIVAGWTFQAEPARFRLFLE